HPVVRSDVLRRCRSCRAVAWDPVRRPAHRAPSSAHSPPALSAARRWTGCPSGPGPDHLCVSWTWCSPSLGFQTLLAPASLRLEPQLGVIAVPNNRPIATGTGQDDEAVVEVDMALLVDLAAVGSPSA